MILSHRMKKNERKTKTHTAERRADGRSGRAGGGEGEGEGEGGRLDLPAAHGTGVGRDDALTTGRSVLINPERSFYLRANCLL